MPFRLRLSVVALALALLVPVAPASADHIRGSKCGVSRACAGHQHWPRMTYKQVKKAHKWRGTTLRGRKRRSNELLGWHGSDRLYGGARTDVLWGDHQGNGQPRGQWDRIWGGAGGDFIYSSHGRNTIYGGPGNDAIKARYGRGVINCGPGRDIVYVPRKRRRNWTFRNCERFDSRTEAARGSGIKPLR